MKLWKYSGYMLAATGIIHTLTGFIMGKDIYAEIIKDGIFNSIDMDYTRGFAFWFFIFGLLLIISGYTVQHYIDKYNEPAPVFFGYSLLAITAIGCFVEPVSGFWLCLPQAIIIIAAKKENT